MGVSFLHPASIHKVMVLPQITVKNTEAHINRPPKLGHRMEVPKQVKQAGKPEATHSVLCSKSRDVSSRRTDHCPYLQLWSSRAEIMPRKVAFLKVREVQNSPQENWLNLLLRFLNAVGCFWFFLIISPECGEIQT